MSDQSNFNQTPEADPQQSLLTPQKVPANHGLLWLRQGLELFLINPKSWLLCVSISVISLLIASVLPIVNLFTIILNSLFMGGFMLACLKLKRENTFALDDLFSGFKLHFSPLALLGLLYLSGFLLVLVVAILLFSLFGLEFTEIKQMTPDTSLTPDQLADLILVPLLIIAILMIPVLMAYWFAPALIVFRKLTPIDAIKLSFKTCSMNLLAFVINTLTLMVIGMLYLILLSIVMAISPMLFFPAAAIGYLIFTSITTAACFSAYQDIFAEQAFIDKLDDAPLDASSLIA